MWREMCSKAFQKGDVIILKFPLVTGMMNTATWNC
ncbi:hypothetical protein NC652_006931 [Populus alba x Populus x berolinensis]|nr:hypothetical protein NC652_006931 [Populus alba x Populus x berolinensis]